jgi:tRNA nucleotidyltransferase (CCA-adding enzyme)
MAAAVDAQDDGAFTDHAGAIAWLEAAAADGRLESWLQEGPAGRPAARPRFGHPPDQ